MWLSIHQTVTWLMQLHQWADRRAWIMTTNTKRASHGLRGWTSSVTDLCENSRYPGLAGAVLFPILLLIVCKKKANHKLFLCARANVYWRVFSPCIPYGASQSPWSHPRGIWGQRNRLRRPLTKNEGWWGGDSALRLPKILSLDPCKMQ